MKNKKIKSNNEISELCSFYLGGYQQKVLIEGKSKDNPIVITLHGGPGTPIPFLLDAEDYFQCLQMSLLWFIGTSLDVESTTM